MYQRLMIRVCSGNKLKLQQFGKALVKEGFAEAAHMMQIESFYMWKGKTFDQYIWSLELMTTEERYASIYALIINNFVHEDVRVMAYPAMMADIFERRSGSSEIFRPENVVDGSIAGER